jgi:hypothetical protein
MPIPSEQSLKAELRSRPPRPSSSVETMFLPQRHSIHEQETFDISLD